MCGGDLVLAKAEGEIAVAFASRTVECLLDVRLALRVIPEVKACQARFAVGHAGFRRAWTKLSFTQKGCSPPPAFSAVPTVQAADPLAVIGGEAVGRVSRPAASVCAFAKAALVSAAPWPRDGSRHWHSRLQFQPALPRCGGVLHFVGFSKSGEQRLRLLDLGKFRRRRKALDAGASTACASAARLVD